MGKKYLIMTESSSCYLSMASKAPEVFLSKEDKDLDEKHSPAFRSLLKDKPHQTTKAPKRMVIARASSLVPLPLGEPDRRLGHRTRVAPSRLLELDRCGVVCKAGRERQLRERRSWGTHYVVEPKWMTWRPDNVARASSAGALSLSCRSLFSLRQLILTPKAEIFLPACQSH
ncbi:hypothetical protein B296_00050648 [Ensete ventricosum]|uniref:Uncharacterized protein n=1 Tax=Ensete ventricosum TaxID=4639 RepID=A0A426XYZ7_ENSVE|nr:hypothetical protein B296_00050648 [Ensete ventricosum]